MARKRIKRGNTVVGDVLSPPVTVPIAVLMEFGRVFALFPRSTLRCPWWLLDAALAL